MRHLDIPQFNQVTTPANPPAGYDSLYFKNDNNLYKLTSAGVESLVGDSGLFVPYTGATSNVDLGIRNLDTTGNITVSGTGTEYKQFRLSSTYLGMGINGGLHWQMTPDTDNIDWLHFTYYPVAAEQGVITFEGTGLLVAGDVGIGDHSFTALGTSANLSIFSSDISGSSSFVRFDAPTTDQSKITFGKYYSSLPVDTWELTYDYNTSSTLTIDNPYEVTATLVLGSPIKLANYTDNGVVTTSGGDGTLSINTKTLLTRVTTLTSAQIKNLSTTPIELVPAPGAGKYIMPISFVIKLNYGSNPFTIAGANPYIDFDNGDLEYLSWASFNWTFLTSTDNDINNSYTIAGSITGRPSSDLMNKRLIIYNAGTNVGGNATNDSTLDILIAYYII